MLVHVLEFSKFDISSTTSTFEVPLDGWIQRNTWRKAQIQQLYSIAPRQMQRRVI